MKLYIAAIHHSLYALKKHTTGFCKISLKLLYMLLEVSRNGCCKILL